MITSPGNSRIKAMAQLRQKARARRERGVFVTEGVKMFQEAPVERIREVYISESFSVKGAGREKWENCPHEIVSDQVFKRLSDTQTPQGILCVVEAFHYGLEDLLRGEAPLLTLLEDIQDPGNLGTIVRTGEGAGISGVIMSRDTVDIYNPKTIRATMGSIYRVPFIYTEDLTGLMEELRARQIRIYAAHLRGELAYDKCDYRTGTAFLIGNEGGGLRDETASRADCYMKIPMAGEVESLNAGVAASLLMYEAARQRRGTEAGR